MEGRLTVYFAIFGCQCRGPLTLLAAMPSGNVAGIIDLEVMEDGYGRMARLSEATLRKIKLPWKCWARLLIGNLLLTHWKVWLLWLLKTCACTPRVRVCLIYFDIYVLCVWMPGCIH